MLRCLTQKHQNDTYSHFITELNNSIHSFLCGDFLFCILILFLPFNLKSVSPLLFVFPKKEKGFWYEDSSGFRFRNESRQNPKEI